MFHFSQFTETHELVDADKLSLTAQNNMGKRHTDLCIITKKQNSGVVI